MQEYVFMVSFPDGTWCQRLLATDEADARQKFLTAIGARDTGQQCTIAQQTFE